MKFQKSWNFQIQTTLFKIFKNHKNFISKPQYWLNTNSNNTTILLMIDPKGTFFFTVRLHQFLKKNDSKRSAWVKILFVFSDLEKKFFFSNCRKKNRIPGKVFSHLVVNFYIQTSTYNFQSHCLRKQSVMDFNFHIWRQYWDRKRNQSKKKQKNDSKKKKNRFWKKMSRKKKRMTLKKKWVWKKMSLKKKWVWKKNESEKKKISLKKKLSLKKKEKKEEWKQNYYILASLKLKNNFPRL